MKHMRHLYVIYMSHIMSTVWEISDTYTEYIRHMYELYFINI